MWKLSCLWIICLCALHFSTSIIQQLLMLALILLIYLAGKSKVRFKRHLLCFCCSITQLHTDWVAPMFILWHTGGSLSSSLLIMSIFFYIASNLQGIVFNAYFSFSFFKGTPYPEKTAFFAPFPTNVVPALVVLQKGCFQETLYLAWKRVSISWLLPAEYCTTDSFCSAFLWVVCQPYSWLFAGCSTQENDPFTTLIPPCGNW